jgi:hypothetical protein
MQVSGFFALLRDIGATLGLFMGLGAIFKGRPFAYVEPDEVPGVLKSHAANDSARSVIFTRSRCFPRDDWYIAPNAKSATSVGQRHAWYGPKDPAPKWQQHNVIVAQRKRHEFFLWQRERDDNPGWCLLVMCWQPLGGVPMPRLPLVLFRTGRQIEHIYRARRSAKDLEL